MSVSRFESWHVTLVYALSSKRRLMESTNSLHFSLIKVSSVLPIDRAAEFIARWICRTMAHIAL